MASAIDRNFQGELVLQNTDGFSPIPPGAAAASRRVPGVATVSTLRSAEAKVIGKGKERITGLDPRTADQVLNLDWEEGSPETLRRLTDRPGDPRQVATPTSNGDELGDRIQLLGQTGRRASLRSSAS